MAKKKPVFKPLPTTPKAAQGKVKPLPTAPKKPSKSTFKNF